MDQGGDWTQDFSILSLSFCHLSYRLSYRAAVKIVLTEQKHYFYRVFPAFFVVVSCKTSKTDKAKYKQGFKDWKNQFKTN